MSVLVTDGRRVQGRVQELTDRTLTLRTKSGTEVLLIERVREVRARRSDPVWNGLIIGATVGTLAGLVPDYYDDCTECHDALYGSIGFGVGVGLLVDALLRRTELVYRAPGNEPTVSLTVQTRGRRTAVVLSFRF